MGSKPGDDRPQRNRSFKSRETVYSLWRLARHIDARIEPIPCGTQQWEEDDSSAIIEIARREGEVVGVQ